MLPVKTDNIIQRKLQNDNDSQINELSERIKQMSQIGSQIGKYIRKE